MEAQAENKRTFLNKLDDNIKKIIKDQVKEEVKAQVSKILPRIEKTVNKQLKAEVMTSSSNESKTSHVVAANLSELELKKILIDKMERNKRRDEEDKDEEPSARSNQGSKRRRAGKEPESTCTPKERTTKTTGKSTDGIIVVTKLQIVEWRGYKHLDWITVRKLTNLNVDDRVESYQKKLNITKPDTYRSDLKCRDAYTAYSNPRGFIYQNKDKKNKLMRIDELHKFSDAGNPVKKILLKLNLSDHRSILTDLKILKDGGGVKEFQRSFRHSDTERLSRSDEVLKLKNFKKDATLKLFKSTNQERYEHVGPEVTSSQDGKVYKMAKRDYAWLMIS
ncbi:hypothetical protein Tco_0459843, partial [Tanacetum coccineum]